MSSNSRSASHHTKPSPGKVPPSSQSAQDPRHNQHSDQTHIAHSASRYDSVQYKRHPHESKGEEQRPGPKSISSARPVSGSNPNPTKDNTTTTSFAKSGYGAPVIENGGGRVKDEIVRKKGDDLMYYKKSELNPEGKLKNHDARKGRDARYYSNSSN